jgi:hypothetical protein
MESIRQGADNNSKSFQANGLLQSQYEYNTTRKIIGKIIGRVRNVVFTRLGAGPSRIELEGLPAQVSAGVSAQG